MSGTLVGCLQPTSKKAISRTLGIPRISLRFFLELIYEE